MSSKTSKAKGKKSKKSSSGVLGGGVGVSASVPTGRTTVKEFMAKNPSFGGRLVSNVDSIPSAFVNILGNSTYFQESKSVMMPNLGQCPVNIVGSQPLSDVTGAVATPDVFTTGTLATSTANQIQLSPDSLNGPLAARANLYDKYVFRDILIEYFSSCATTQANSIALAIEEDGSGLGAPTSFSTTRQIVPSVAFPLRADRCFLHYHYRGPNLWWNLLDNATVAGSRSTVQCDLYGYASANLTVIVPGFINIYYSIDLYDPVLSQGFTMSVRKDERLILNAFVQHFRRLSEKERQAMIAEFRMRFSTESEDSGFALTRK